MDTGLIFGDASFTQLVKDMTVDAEEMTYLNDLFPTEVTRAEMFTNILNVKVEMFHQV